MNFLFLRGIDPAIVKWITQFTLTFKRIKRFGDTSSYICMRGLNSPFRITENVEILNIICCRQKSEILSTVVLLKNLKIYLLKLFINKSRHFYLVKCVY